MDSRCLLVSVDSALRMKLAIAFRRAGLEVLAARTPHQALLCFGDQRVGAVVCDLEELGGDVLATLRSLRGNDARFAPMVFTLGAAPVDPSLAVHVDRTTPAAYIAAMVANALQRRAYASGPGAGPSQPAL